MALRKIRLSNDPILRKISKPVAEINEATYELLDDMIETMYANEGAGLAAVQVGTLKRIVVIDCGEDFGGLIELINPEFLEKSGSQVDAEGCLSFPGYYATVERPDYVKVRAQNRHGEWITYEAQEFLARAFCHELDHLDGVLYPDVSIDGLQKLPEEQEEN